MKKYLWLCGIIFPLLYSFGSAQGQNMEGPEILEKADEIRGGGRSVVLEAIITAFKSGKKDNQIKIEILSKYKERKTLIKSLYPPRDKGRFMLMVGDDFWIYLPRAKRPFRISPIQRLLGSATYADIARPTYSGDYYVSLLDEEAFKDKECYILELLAKNKKVAYHRVIYWVEKETFRPLRADFFVVSGKLMKTAFFENYKYKEDLKRYISTELRIIDHFRKDEETLIDYTKIKPQELADKIFSREHLEKMR